MIMSQELRDMIYATDLMRFEAEARMDDLRALPLDELADDDLIMDTDDDDLPSYSHTGDPYAVKYPSTFNLNLT